MVRTLRPGVAPMCNSGCTASGTGDSGSVCCCLHSKTSVAKFSNFYFFAAILLPLHVCGTAVSHPIHAPEAKVPKCGLLRGGACNLTAINSVDTTATWGTPARACR